MTVISTCCSEAEWFKVVLQGMLLSKNSNNTLAAEVVLKQLVTTPFSGKFSVICQHSAPIQSSNYAQKYSHAYWSNVITRCCRPFQVQAQGCHSISMDQRLQKPYMEERYKTQVVPVSNSLLLSTEQLSNQICLVVWKKNLILWDRIVSRLIFQMVITTLFA